MTDSYAPYDYAWKTPGWSVQNPTFLNTPDSYPAQGLPDVSLVTVSGSFPDRYGRGMEGVLRLRRSDTLVHNPSRTLIMPDVQVIRFRPAGFVLPLMATDDPDLTPSFRYYARLTVAGYVTDFSFTLPAATPMVNIIDLMPDPTGSIDIDVPTSDEDLELGAVPLKMTVNLVTGSAFSTDVTADISLAAENASLELRFANGTVWTATVTGDVAYFGEPVSAADTIPDGTGVSLVASVAGTPTVWASGTVVRHG